MAARLRDPQPSCIFHSDRGTQYASGDYKKRLKAYEVNPLMNGKGNSYDNAAVETFFKTIKTI